MTTSLTPIELVPGTILSDVVFESIGAAILDGRLSSGERVRDVDLATQLGVSRTPVREALQRLERLGLVEIAVGRHTVVTTPTEQMRSDSMEALAYYLCGAARAAFARCSDQQLAVVVASLDGMIEASVAGDPLLILEYGVGLVEALTAASGNVVFGAFISETGLAFRRNLWTWQPIVASRAEQIDGLRALRAAAAARDADLFGVLFRHQYDII